MVSAVSGAEGINYYKMLNENLAREVNHLHEEIRYYREVNSVLLKKIGITEQIKNDIDIGILSPIGGYISTKEKIKKAEKEARELYLKEIQGEQDANQ